MDKLAALLLSVGALALIAWGAWLIYRPAAPLVVGGLLWVDLTLWGRATSTRPKKEGPP